MYDKILTTPINHKYNYYFIAFFFSFVVAFNFIIDFSFNNRSTTAAETYVMELSDKVQANLVDDLFCEAENARVHGKFKMVGVCIIIYNKPIVSKSTLK